MRSRPVPGRLLLVLGIRVVLFETDVVLNVFRGFAEFLDALAEALGEIGMHRLYRHDLALEVADELHLLQPQPSVHISRVTPERFLKAAGRVIRKGYGFPSLFNSDAVVKELVRQGKTVEDAREGGTSGCVEAGAFGKEAFILTGYFNLPKMLELAREAGSIKVDPGHLEQVIMNLAVNAMDASPAGGKITWRLERNAEQVAKVRRILEELGLVVARPDEARQMLKLKGGNNVNF